MSIAIDNLQIGCTGAELVAKINEIISVLSGMEQTTDYELLINKPSINGVELSGNKRTGELDIALADAVGFKTLIDTLATKQNLSDASTEIVEMAADAAEQVLNSKVDVDNSKVVEATMLNEKGYVYISAPEGLRKVTIENLCKNVALKMMTGYTSVIHDGSDSGPKKITLDIEPENWDVDEEYGFVAKVESELPVNIKTAISSPSPDSIDEWTETPFYLVDCENGICTVAAEVAPKVKVSINIIYR